MGRGKVRIKLTPEAFDIKLIRDRILEELGEYVWLDQGDEANINTPTWQALLDGCPDIYNAMLYTAEISKADHDAAPGVPATWRNAMITVLDENGDPTYEEDGVTPVTKRKRWHEYTQVIWSDDGTKCIMRIMDSLRLNSMDENNKFKPGGGFGWPVEHETLLRFTNKWGWQNWRHGQLWIANNTSQGTIT